MVVHGSSSFAEPAASTRPMPPGLSHPIVAATFVRMRSCRHMLRSSVHFLSSPISTLANPDPTNEFEAGEIREVDVLQGSFSSDIE